MTYREKCVNALVRATLISTLWKKDLRQLSIGRVNALVRATLISTMYNPIRAFLTQILCKCPRTGNTHFYVRLFGLLLPVTLCKCPRTGNTHFYRIIFLSL